MYHKPRLHGHSDPDPDPDWLRLHGGKVDSNPDSDHLSHVDCDPDSNPDSGPGARVNAAIVVLFCYAHSLSVLCIMQFINVTGLALGHGLATASDTLSSQVYIMYFIQPLARTFSMRKLA